jgi:cellulose synthase/poly-beta-1,6-N-acetylglucosamine synthase-like glycosyltransferase
MLFGKIIYIIFLICFIYLALSVSYLFLLSFAGRFFRFRRKMDSFPAEPMKKIAVLVPAYREDGIIMSTATHLLQADYPRGLYRVFIIADSFRPETVAALRSLPLEVVEVSFDKSTKTKSLNEAFRRISDAFDIALICDADNMPAGDFLKRVNNAFVHGARAVQGKRVAKNLDTPFAILDACSEAINNHIFRKGAYAIGLSSSVIGSGMAFEFGTIRTILSEIRAVGGFDKILQLKVVEQGICIHYLEDALVYDEKVGTSQAFQQQRKRWVSSQFIYLKQFFGPACRQLIRGNPSYFNLAIANNLVLPRAFLFVLLPALLAAGFFIGGGWFVASACICGLYLLSLLMGLPGELVNRDLLVALLRLPKAIAVMVGTIFHIKKANKTFIHTVHTKTEISSTVLKDTGK